MALKASLELERKTRPSSTQPNRGSDFTSVFVTARPMAEVFSPNLETQ